jgi:hypothetical protein
MACFLDAQGSYYEGDRAHALDIQVPQRPTADHRWESGAWVVDAPEVLLDRKAARAIDTIDRLQFEHLFDLENRMRTQEALSAITRVQYRSALIARWKALQA